MLTITPGADMALVTRNAVTGGRRAALATTLGIVTGVTVWAGASATGIAALLAASATAFTAVKLAGAAYLVFLGANLLWDARAKRAPAEPRMRREALPSGGSAFGQGLVTNLLNPKIAVFYTSVLPQFIVPGDSALLKSLTLAGIHNVLSLVWLYGYAGLITAAGTWLERPSTRRALDRVTGSVLVALGLRLAVDAR